MKKNILLIWIIFLSLSSRNNDIQCQNTIYDHVFPNRRTENTIIRNYTSNVDIQYVIYGESQPYGFIFHTPYPYNTVEEVGPVDTYRWNSIDWIKNTQYNIVSGETTDFQDGFLWKYDESKKNCIEIFPTKSQDTRLVEKCTEIK